VGDTGYLTSFSIDGEHCLDTSSEATQSHSNVLRVDSNGRGTPEPSQGILAPRLRPASKPPSIDSLVPDILLECEGRSGEDGAQATRALVV
jgi:hypothetical protein